jgi:hypothetical protein
MTYKVRAYAAHSPDGLRGVTSAIEIIRVRDIDAAYEGRLRSDVKYCFVIDLASPKEGVAD